MGNDGQWRGATSPTLCDEVSIFRRKLEAVGKSAPVEGKLSHLVFVEANKWIFADPNGALGRVRPVRGTPRPGGVPDGESTCGVLPVEQEVLQMRKYRGRPLIASTRMVSCCCLKWGRSGWIRPSGGARRLQKKSVQRPVTAAS